MAQPPAFPPEAWDAIKHSAGYMNELAELRAKIAYEATEGPRAVCWIITLITATSYVYLGWYREWEFLLAYVLPIVGLLAGCNAWVLGMEHAGLKRDEIKLREKWMRLKGFTPVPPAADGA